MVQCPRAYLALEVVSVIRALMERVYSYLTSNKSPDSILDIGIIDYAIRELEMNNSNFDGLDAKAGGIVQFVAVILGLSVFQASATNSFGILQLLALGALGVALVLALSAWWVRGTEAVPSAISVKERLDDVGTSITSQELIDCINKASTAARLMCLKKFKYLRYAFILVLVGVVLLMVSLSMKL